MVEIFNTGVEIILGIRVVCFQIKGGFTLSRNCCYLGSCVKFSFAKKIEAMYERSLVNVKARGGGGGENPYETGWDARRHA